MTRIAVVGDVHGRPLEFMALLLRLERHGVDRIVQVGDLVDRGPTADSSIQAIRIARGWKFTARNGESRPIEVILGNHEENHLYARRQEKLPFRDFVPTTKHKDVQSALTQGDIDWLDSLPHWLTIDEPGHKLCFTHGGILNWMKTPGWYGKKMGSLLCRIGYLGPHGQILQPQQTSDVFWADEYDGRHGKVFFGHTSFSKIKYFPHAVGVDCSKFGSVAGLVWSTEGEAPVEMYEKHFTGASAGSASATKSESTPERLAPSSTRRERRQREFRWNDIDRFYENFGRDSDSDSDFSRR